MGGALLLILIFDLLKLLHIFFLWVGVGYGSIAAHFCFLICLNYSLSPSLSFPCSDKKRGGGGHIAPQVSSLYLKVTFDLFQGFIK